MCCLIICSFFLASTRQKMIYASTKSTLKTEFGLSLIKEEYHATQIEEMTYKGYLKNLEFLSAPKVINNIDIVNDTQNILLQSL